MKKLLLSILALSAVLNPLLAHAGAALLVEEPYGPFGSGVPIGHSAIYLPQVCAATPTQLRRCNPGELGVVLSRYRRVAGRDWLAIPLVPYLYAVDRVENVPASVDEQKVRALRDQYRHAHLCDIVPDAPDGGMPDGTWTELIGASYDRQIYVFEFDTTPAQDDNLIAALNSASNRTHFNLFFHNCADFSRKLINFYRPGAVRRSLTADLGITTPKQLAKSLVKYGKRHENLELTTAVIAQVPGSVGRSHRPHGVVEALLKSKKYAIPLAPVAVVHPYIAAGVVVSYFMGGSRRFQPPQSSEVLTNPEQVQLLAEHFAQGDEPRPGEPRPYLLDADVPAPWDADAPGQRWPLFYRSTVVGGQDPHPGKTSLDGAGSRE